MLPPWCAGMYALSLGVQKMPDRLPPIVYALLSGMNASTVGIIALAAVQVRETRQNVYMCVCSYVVETDTQCLD